LRVVLPPRSFALPVRTLALLGAGALLGVAVNSARPAGVHPGSFEVATTCTAPHAETPIAVLPPAHAAHLCGAPGVLIADVRTAERFADGHVAGAIHLPCAASGDVLGRALGAVAGKHTLVVYGETTADAEAVALSLRERLPRTDLAISVLAGGFAAWNAEGLACSSGPCPECGPHARERGADQTSSPVEVSR
jgi:rhodanese-related sulfurtransferase